MDTLTKPRYSISKAVVSAVDYHTGGTVVQAFAAAIDAVVSAVS
jgi:hypothetical protein